MNDDDAAKRQPLPALTRYGAPLDGSDALKVSIALKVSGRHVTGDEGSGFTVFTSSHGPVERECADVPALAAFAAELGLRPFDLPAPPPHATDQTHGHWPTWGQYA